MKNYLAVDCGTTNTRIYLIRGNSVCDTIKFNVGAGKCLNDKSLLEDTIKTGIVEILDKNGLAEDDIYRILASGMITSEFGLYEAEHIKAPAGIKELHDSMVEVTLAEISRIPFVFIRGIKSMGKTFEDTDMMRGEEAEYAGLSELLSEDPSDTVYVLPGTHSKLIKTDSEGRIAEFSTMMTGELFAAVVQNTILKEAVDLSNVQLDREYLIKGFTYCRDNGINKALFKVRIIKNMFAGENSQVYSFLLGAILCGEIEEILKCKPKRTVIGGNQKLKDASCEILNFVGDCETIPVPDKTCEIAAPMGMVRIFENR